MAVVARRAMGRLLWVVVVVGTAIQGGDGVTVTGTSPRNNTVVPARWNTPLTVSVLILRALGVTGSDIQFVGYFSGLATALIYDGLPCVYVAARGCLTSGHPQRRPW